jgi:hypothetical protein
VRRVLAALCLACGLLAELPAAGHTYSAGELTVRHPWSRATPPGAKMGAVYFEIRNADKAPDRVIGASTPVAERVEMHVELREGDVLKMREVSRFEVPARQRLALTPGGSHLMLVGLKKPLAAGDRFPLTLRLERGGELKVEVEVQAVDSRKPHH